jgi:glycosyltransferase involved in cell wall biosynthesis
LSFCRRLGFQPSLGFFVHATSDAVIFTNYVSLPVSRKRKTALIIYDLGFLDVPEYTQAKNLRFLQRFCPPSIRRADVIITISEFTKSRLQHHFPGLSADIVVTPIPPIDETIRQPSLSNGLKEKGIQKGKYILYLGTIEPRKNLEKLITAYGALGSKIRQSYALVLAGGQGWKDEGILAAVAEQQANGMNIILTGYVPEEEKNALYANAACFILPSHYEGFGMPAFEAMQHDVPVALSDIPVFREVAGDAAVYFDKDSSGDMADKLAALINDKALCKKLIRNGRERLLAFSWQENADKVYKALV